MDHALKIIGAIAATRAAFSVSSWFYRNLCARSNLRKLGAGSGAYVVITGASDGIGRGLAEEGAERGFNLVLVARSKDKLDAIAKEVKGKHGVDVKVLVLDLAAEDVSKTVRTITDLCKTLDVSILINNVGTTGGSPIALEDQNPEDILKIVHLKCVVLASLTGN